MVSLCDGTVRPSSPFSYASDDRAEHSGPLLDLVDLRGHQDCVESLREQARASYRNRDAIRGTRAFLEASPEAGYGIRDPPKDETVESLDVWALAKWLGVSMDKIESMSHGKLQQALDYDRYVDCVLMWREYGECGHEDGLLRDGSGFAESWYACPYRAEPPGNPWNLEEPRFAWEYSTCSEGHRWHFPTCGVDCPYCLPVNTRGNR